MSKYIAFNEIAPFYRLEIVEEVLESDSGSIGNKKSLVSFFYLYVYERETEKTIADFVQENLQFAKEDALEFYGVPLDAWVEV